MKLDDKTILKHITQGVGGLIMLNTILDIIENKSEITDKLTQIQFEFKKRIEEDEGSKMAVVSINEVKDV